ncbi:MAG: hypothetical protein CM15mP120_01520 [Pseudomonadota bacterium]|nr:MAG: hypothetical protein CM15mP120_01520 [Pseudomonadota bacterium]
MVTLDAGLVDGGVFAAAAVSNVLLLRYMPLKFPGKVFLIMQLSRIVVLLLMWVEPEMWLLVVATIGWGLNMGVTTTFGAHHRARIRRGPIPRTGPVSIQHRHGRQCTDRRDYSGLDYRNLWHPQRLGAGHVRLVVAVLVWRLLFQGLGLPQRCGELGLQPPDN